MTDVVPSTFSCFGSWESVELVLCEFFKLVSLSFPSSFSFCLSFTSFSLVTWDIFEEESLSDVVPSTFSCLGTLESVELVLSEFFEFVRESAFFKFFHRPHIYMYSLGDCLQIVLNLHCLYFHFQIEPHHLLPFLKIFYQLDCWSAIYVLY